MLFEAPDMEDVKDALFERYITAFEEWDHLKKQKHLAVKKVYAADGRYHPEKYEEMGIPPGGPLSLKPAGDHYYMYGLDILGRPCFSQHRNTQGTIYQEGFYSFGEQWIEYIEYNVATQKPVVLQRIQLHKKQKRMYQQLLLNNGGPGKTYDGLSRPQIAARLKEAEYDRFCCIELYQYRGNRIIAADCWASYPGYTPGNYKKKFTYLPSGELNTIRDNYSNGTSKYVFVRMPDNMSLDELSDKLAQQMAQVIAAACARRSPHAPIAMLQLSYQEIGNYIPYVTAITTNTKDQIFRETPREELQLQLFTSAEYEHIPVPHEKYERLFVAFMNKIEKDKNFDLATGMIRKTGYLLTTNRMYGKVPVDADFIAYAVDWSMTFEEEEIYQILIDCGITAATMTKWKELGLFTGI